MVAIFTGAFCPAFNTETSTPTPTVSSLEILTLQKEINKAYDEAGQIRILYPSVDLAALSEYRDVKSENSLQPTVDAERRRTCYRR
jgi:hypothetical protein